MLIAALLTLAGGLLYVFGEAANRRAQREQLAPLHKGMHVFGGGFVLDPIHFIEVFAAVITILDATRRSTSVTAPPSVFQVRENSRNLSGVSDEDIEEAIDFTIRLTRLDDKFVDRIHKKCLPPYYKAIEDGSNEEVDEEKAAATICVCHSLKNIRDMNGGRLPDDELKDLWNRFRCGLIT